MLFLDQLGMANILCATEKKNAREIKDPETTKIVNLNSDINVIQGKKPIRDARLAPIPRVTSNAGNAQQTKVPNEVKRLNDGNKV